MRSFNFPGAVVEMREDGVTVSRFDGWRMLTAVPEDNEEYRQRARDLGYGDDTLRMSREHELMHHMLASWLGLPHSPALFEAANEQSKSVVAGCEEGAVLALQRFCNAVGVNVMALAERCRSK